jgi:hypothetical protein
VPYLDNYWSDSFGPKCDLPVFGVFHLPKYFGNLSNFISHAIPKFQKTSVIDHGNTTWMISKTLYLRGSRNNIIIYGGQTALTPGLYLLNLDERTKEDQQAYLNSEQLKDNQSHLELHSPLP